MNNDELIKKRIEDEIADLKEKSGHFLGFPTNSKFDYSDLFGFLQFSFNNVGDPFVSSNYALDSREFEVEVLQFFAELYKIPIDEYWGYVTNGGTEGNMHGLFLGREMIPDGVLYFSADSHYSIFKIAHVLNVDSSVVPSNEDGSMDLEQLELILKHSDRKPIFNLNIGSTMKGAIDDVDGVLAVLEKLGITDYYIHCDAALFGMLLPFLDGAPVINFTKPIGSIAISGHKFIGSPIPCGIELTRKKYVDNIKRPVEYIDTYDTTISGSRNAFTPIVLWYAIQKRGIDGFKKEANTCIENAHYLHGRFQEMQYDSFLNKFSNTVVFKRPSNKFMKQWQLAPQGDWSHVVVMQHVTKEVIDRFIEDLKKD